ncbi:SurA N-terminal domain-containing protein [Candidatus Microgenomates bacterium]|nr:SurA N-terminal domain-containing protein [Candidatus Microgenomates bacterium]
MATKKRSSKTTARRTRVSVSEPVEEYSPISSPVEHKPSDKKKYLLPLSVLVILALLYAFKGMFIAATVNGQPIGRLTVIRELEKQSGKRALENLVTKSLIIQEGKKKNITVSDTDIANQIKKIEKNISAQGMTLDQALQAQGMSKDALKEELKVQLIAQKLVGDKVNITDKDVADYQSQNKEMFAQNPSQAPSAEQIREQLKQQKQQQLTQDYITKLRKDAKVAYYTSY